MLELDWVTVAFEIFNFLVLTALLYRFLFKPVMRNVQARATKKEQLLRQAEQDKEAAAKARAELETRLAHADEEAQEIISQARQQMEAERAELIRQTQDEVERILAEARIDIHRWRQQSVDDFHHELVETTLDISRWIIGGTAPRETHDALVQQLSRHVWDLGRNGMEQVETIRRGLKGTQPTIAVTTARPLSSEQQSNLLNTFTALADRPVKLELETNAQLAAGLHVRLGDTVIDNSIAGQLDDLRQEVDQALKQRILQEASPSKDQALAAEATRE